MLLHIKSILSKLLIAVSGIGVMCLSCSVFARLNNSPTMLSSSINQFGFKFYQHMQKNTMNVAISPYHLFSLLSAVSHYARGDNKKNLLETIGVGPGDHIAQRLHELNRYLGKQRAANAVWIDHTYAYKQMQISPKYRNMVHIRSLKFSHHGDLAENIISNWSNDRAGVHTWPPTHMHLCQRDTQMLVTSLIAARTPWQYPFSPQKTTLSQFNNGKQHSMVKMMHQKHFFPYYSDKQSEMVVLPYRSGHRAMAILLPKSGQKLADIVSKLSLEKFRHYLYSSKYKDINLKLPKLQITMQTLDVIPTLQSLGLEIPFQQNHLYPGLTARRVHISNILQTTNFIINENNQRHISNSNTPNNSLSAPKHYIPFIVNHPFIAIVFDFDSGTILLLAQITHIQNAFNASSKSLTHSIS